MKEKNRFYKVQLIWIRIRHGLFLYSVRNLLTRIGIDIEPYYWIQEGLDKNIAPEIKGNDSEYLLGELNLEEVKKVISNSSGMSLLLDKIVKKFNNGQICIALKHQNEVAAYMFIELNDFIYRHKTIPIKNNEAYLLNMYTFQSYRGKNLAPYLRYKSYEKLKDMGRVSLYSITTYFNTSSMKFKKKLEAKKLNLSISIELFKKFHWHFLIKEYKN
jgi:Acetyltransferase (GNAT) family